MKAREQDTEPQCILLGEAPSLPPRHLARDLLWSCGRGYQIRRVPEGHEREDGRRGRHIQQRSPGCVHACSHLGCNSESTPSCCPAGSASTRARMAQRNASKLKRVDLRVRDVIELDDLCVSAWFARLRAGRCVRRAEAADHAYFPESSTVASTTAHRGKEVQQVSAVRCSSPAEGPRVHENSIASTPTVIMADDGYPKCLLCCNKYVTEGHLQSRNKCKTANTR